MTNINIYFPLIENTMRGVMPSKIHRHPGGRGAERAHLLSGGGSDGQMEYNSDGSVGPPMQLQAARSASLDLVREIGAEGREAVVDVHDAPFTDLTEDDALINSSHKS